MQRDHVAETDCRQGDEAIVNGIEVGPPLVPGERGGAAGDSQARQRRYHADEIYLRGLQYVAC